MAVRAVRVVGIIAVSLASGCGQNGGSTEPSGGLRWQWLAVSPTICHSCPQTADDPNFGRQTLSPDEPPGWGIIGYNTPQPGLVPWFTVSLGGKRPSFEFSLDNSQNHQQWPDGVCASGTCVPPFVGVLARPGFGTLPAGLKLDGNLEYRVKVTLGPGFGVVGESLPCTSASGDKPFARFEVGVVLHDNERDRNWWVSWSLFRQEWPDFFCGIDGCFLFVNADAGLIGKAAGAAGLALVEAGEPVDLSFDLSRAIAETVRLGAERACPLPPLDPAATVIGLWVGAEVHGDAVVEFAIESPELVENFESTPATEVR